MEQELGALARFSHPKRPVVFVLGGAKPDDSLPILKAWLEARKLDSALCGGLLGSLMLLASGRELGGTTRFLEKKEALAKLDEAKALLLKYPDKIVLPSDVVVDAGGNPVALNASQLPSPHPIMDIGPHSAQRFAAFIHPAGSVVMNGPMGVYEKDEFANGTRAVLEAVASSKGFSLLGGGHTLSALDKFKTDKARIGYISLSGKALIEYLSGEKLPGVEMLQRWAKKGAKSGAKKAKGR
jgi:phosphoglycerate kinase